MDPADFKPPPRDPFKIARTRLWTIGSVIEIPGTRAEDLKMHGLFGWQGRSILGYRVPDFQRPYMWSRAQQAAFVESAWEGYDIGRWVLNIHETSDRRGVGALDGLIVDGQQRLGAIEAYVRDAFPVYGALWSDVPKLQGRRGFLDRSFPCVESAIEDPVELERVYRRLAYGGTPHQAATTVPALEAARDRARSWGDHELVALADTALREWAA